MTDSETNLDWKLFRGTREADGDIKRLPPPPAWRDFRDDDQGSAELQQQKGQLLRNTFRSSGFRNKVKPQS